MNKPLAATLLWLSFAGIAWAASPVATPTGLGAIATPAGTPTPVAAPQCRIEAQDLTAGGGIIYSGTLSAPATNADVINVKVISANALNSLLLNGSPVPGLTNVAAGTNVNFVVNSTGVWTFTINGGAACNPNPINIVGY